MTFFHWIIFAVATALVSMAITGVIIPQILLIAFRRRLFDGVDERKIHHGSVPRLGGIAFVPSIILSIAFVMGVGMMLQGMRMFHVVYVSQPVSMCFAMCGLMMLYLVGIADDLIGVKYRAKFVVQIFAAALMCASGLWINDLNGFLGITALPPAVGILLTLLVVVFIINSINLIDGIDGLASGLSAIGLLCYGTLFLVMRHYVLAVIAFATLGTLIPFFFFNVMGDAIKKKKIFMGDTGTLTVGFILSFMAVEMSRSGGELQGSVDAVVLAFSPLILPCFDVVRVFVHRIRMKQNPFLPDRSHIHHKLLALGLNQRVVMVLILLMALAYAAGSIWMSQYLNVTAVLAIDFGLWILFNWRLTKFIYKRQQREKAETAGKPKQDKRRRPQQEQTLEYV